MTVRVFKLHTSQYTHKPAKHVSDVNYPPTYYEGYGDTIAGGLGNRGELGARGLRLYADLLGFKRM